MAIDTIARGVALAGKQVYTVGMATASRPSDYFCAGSADQVAINRAIAACDAAGGGVVRLGPGTYDITATVLLSGVENVRLEWVSGSPGYRLSH